ncbi:hypothetical protein ACEUAT_19540, partial [Aeromonas veronii]
QDARLDTYRCRDAKSGAARETRAGAKRGCLKQLCATTILKNAGNKRQEKLKTVLKSTNGVYVFYDSRGTPLYVGKAKDQCLWDEMKSAFNRDRKTQKIRTVLHPENGSGFSPAYDSPRKIEWKHLQLCQLATYFSAYEAHTDMINRVEALLIRAFANSIMNARMETFP